MDHKNYQAPAQLLADKIILVTGAGDGIGRTAALTFAEYGATVILLGRTVAKLEKVYDEIEARGGAQPAIYPICLDGAAEKDYLDMQQNLEREFGRLDGLLHNAGELGPRTSLASYKLSDWQRVMQVNVTAEFMMTKALLPLLEKSANGSIVFTSSGVGRVGRAFWGAYAISKFAVEGMSQILAAELEEISRIRVNCINPGATRTQMRATAYPAEDPTRLKTPADIMPTYLYLLGDDSIGISSQSLDAQ